MRPRCQDAAAAVWRSRCRLPHHRGAAISRAQLIRALLDAFAETDIDLTIARSEADLRKTILACLGKYRLDL